MELKLTSWPSPLVEPVRLPVALPPAPAANPLLASPPKPAMLIKFKERLPLALLTLVLALAAPPAAPAPCVP
jgi:hypothetical protein